MRKVIVTGAGGFIGSHLCARFLEDEIEVIGIDGTENTEKLDYIGRNACFEFINEPIEKTNMKKHLKGVDVIFHLACTVRPNCRWHNIEHYVKQHIERLKRIYDAIPSKKTKLIFVSSYEVYGKRHGEVTETSATNPETLYGLIKLTEENYVHVRSAEKNIPFVILRLPTVYGPWQPGDMTFQNIINSRIKGDSCKFEKDSVTEDVLYVEDAVESIYLAAKQPVENAIYNISSGKRDEWKRGLEALSVKVEHLPKEKRNMMISGKLAKNDLGFQPRTTVEEGIKKQMRHSERTIFNRQKR
ncbi:NAD-dependent epimerase/dehydratase family protein [Fictibacillus gelatini]|uniref:NAD-dependent epimerase/dehydratase family protein n=1 Tax=Fictibacillus gelatini TaxID=225985 RepID=UPI0004220804|nr:NAD(P)-dependent oxidoreductase [Fictibacillus gelatini]